MSGIYMPGIPYLEMSDFNPDLSLKSHVGKGKPVVCMAQGAFCHFCTQAKPAYMDFANQVKGKIVVVTIQIDSEKDLGQIISQLDPTYQGVPTYLLFDSTGRYVSTHKGGRDVASLMASANSLH